MRRTITLPEGGTVTGDLGYCRGPHCRAEILWVLTKNGKRTPLDMDGQPHWATCPDRTTFQRQQQR